MRIAAPGLAKERPKDFAEKARDRSILVRVGTEQKLSYVHQYTYSRFRLSSEE